MSKKIVLNSMEVRNFKGIKEQKIEFGEVTNIFGENGIGKSTIQDAFMFLLFNKDSSDNAKFDIQPLDKDGNKIHNLETSITAAITINGKEIALKRIYKEKYSKTKGTKLTEFKGYVSEYYVNEVPQKVGEYKDYVSSLLDEKLFKLITSPSYFPSLPWKEKREIITEIVGDMDAVEIINSNKDLEPLLLHFTDAPVEDFVKMVKSKISKLKKDRQQLPSRIDEASKSIVEHDYAALEKEKKISEKRASDIDIQIASKGKLNEGFFSLKEKLMAKEYELAKEKKALVQQADVPKDELIDNIRREKSWLKSAMQDKETLEVSIKSNTDYLDVLKSSIKELREGYREEKENNFEFDENSTVCPTCNRKYESEDVEEIRNSAEKKFNTRKAEAIKRNIEQGKKLKERITKGEEIVREKKEDLKSKEDKIKAFDNSVKEKEKELEEFKALPVVDNPVIKGINKEIESLRSEIDNFNAADVSALRDDRRNINEILANINTSLAAKESNKKLKMRIAELEAKEDTICEKIAELEGLEILSEEFTRTKVKLMENEVNSKFKYVSFKMFKNQINGGLEECCEPCVNGVPYMSNLNNGAKINAGLDIINTLCGHYGVNAPIFIDNAESVNEIIPVESQVIRLVVSHDKELRIEKIHVPTKEEKKEVRQMLEGIKKGFSDYDTCIEFPSKYWDEVHELETDYGEKHRWWQYKTINYELKGQKFQFEYQEPLTEMQEGQDTNPTLYILEDNEWREI